ncbi:MAG: Uma2 family endonuclease [Acidobacteriota bacterium]|nr:Uma2 family endonuclease [Acidobacteriota bacterium]
MSTTAVQPITVEQFLRFQSPRGFRCELIDGEIILSPDPKAPHYDIAERVYDFLRQTCREPRYKTLQRLNLLLQSTDQMPSPDVMVIDFAAWIEAQASGYPKTAPFLVVEVISPSNRKRRIEAKVQAYLANGTSSIWVIYPKKRIVQVHRDSETITYSGTDTLSLPAELSSASFAVRQLFSFAEKLTVL